MTATTSGGILVSGIERERGTKSRARQLPISADEEEVGGQPEATYHLLAAVEKLYWDRGLHTSWETVRQQLVAGAGGGRRRERSPESACWVRLPGR